MKFLMVFVLFGLVAVGSQASPLTQTQTDLFKNQNNFLSNNEIDLLIIILKSELQAIFSKIDKNVGFSKKATEIINLLREASNILGQTSPDPDIMKNLSNMVHQVGINKNDFCQFRIAMTSFLKEQLTWEPQVQNEWTDAFDAIYYETFKKV
jgi:hypothetical protein